MLTAAAVAAPTTAPPTDVGATGATLNGTVDGPAQDVHFEYGRAASGTFPRATESRTVADAGDVSIRAEGMTPETEYRYRIVADGEVGNVQTLTTTANPSAPTISNQRARNVSTHAATATASVNPNGNATTFTVEWGTTTRYGNRTTDAAVGSGRAPATVTATLTGLRPYTRYHWRTVATNGVGVTRGRDRTFRTLRQPGAVSIGL